MSQEPYLLAKLRYLPNAVNSQRIEVSLAQWREQHGRLDDPELADFARRLESDPLGRQLLEVVFAYSPFLTQCILTDISGLQELLSRGPATVLREAREGITAEAATSTDQQHCMRVLRHARRRTALSAALADIAGEWDLNAVVQALSDFADAAVGAALSHLLLRASERGDIELAESEHPTEDCGIAVLAMGKLGARELNYSSDIDLIVLYDPERLRYKGKKDAHHFAVRLTQDMVRLLEERTREGYVARVDLRLRPDPSAMPVAIPFQAAETYYESLGQNWERAAMIKARTCAGDLALGREFLSVLRPFVWRKHLDFWAIQDVHSIKRQIHAHRGGSVVAVEGHDIKLGRGGIREIEFYAQTQQLIWGGRMPELRAPRTLDALDALAKSGYVDPGDAAALSEAYVYLRRLEHRLQMIEDQQTQSLPPDDAGVAEVAAFMGYEDAGDFRAELLHHLRTVEDRYAALFEEEVSLSGPGNLVFTGGEPDPETVATLNRLGFDDGERVFHVVANWHRGRYRATRSRRAREILTELVPALLEALGRTANPDAALAKFDEFLSGLPAGVQLFSMLHANPKLLDLLASIIGAAPALAETLSRRPGLLDGVLTTGFFEALPERDALMRELEVGLGEARDFQDVLDTARRWANDRKFQAGVHLLQGISDIDEVGRALSDVAETAVACLWPHVLEEFAQAHGRLPGSGLALLALGKLGGREMTVSSDLDLIFIYETEAGAEMSDGAKPLEPGTYYARLAQRVINAITAPTGEGRLYEIDMRLRPSGKAGPIATTLAGFKRYHDADAWTWERMALTRARLIAGDTAFRERIARSVREVLTTPRDPGETMAAVVDMRARVEKQFPAKSDLHVKYLRGGLVDLEFLSQALQVCHGHAHPEVLTPNTQDAFARLAEAGVLTAGEAKTLIAATRLMRRVQGLLRLMAGSAFDEADAPGGLKAKLAEACGERDFERLRTRVLDTTAEVRDIFAAYVERPAEAAAGSAHASKQ